MLAQPFEADKTTDNELQFKTGAAGEILFKIWALYMVSNVGPLPTIRGEQSALGPKSVPPIFTVSLGLKT